MASDRSHLERPSKEADAKVIQRYFDQYEAWLEKKAADDICNQE
jgi:hypothetical protein